MRRLAPGTVRPQLAWLRRDQSVHGPSDRRSAKSAKRPSPALITGTAAALALLLVSAIHRPHLRLVWTASASVPVGLYRIDPVTDLRTGDLVAIRPPADIARFMANRRYVESGALLLKPIAATGGANVCRHDLLLTINGVPVAKALLADRFHRPLPRWSGCVRVRHDQLFLLAPEKPDSFDGRYFGPIAASAVVGRAVPLWTWP
jgi:conjugative transfer signal peptidase TraF